jgi:hypothetical protein
MLFFFNLAGAVHDPDPKGVALASVALARLEAVRYLASFVSEHPDLALRGDGLRVEVTDAQRRPVATIRIDARPPY